MLESDTKGGHTIIVSGKHYHSRHAPEREAEKYLSTLSLGDRRICILVAPGGRHLEAAIRARHPACRVYSLQPALFRNQAANGPTASDWYEDSPLSLVAQLSAWLDDEDAGAVEMVVWPPAWQHFPQFCADCGTAIASFIKEASANLQTSAYFGRRWLANAVGNLLNVCSVAGLGSSNGTVVLAGSGPGLLDCRELLQSSRSRYSLWALPSSLRALATWGLVPDVLVTSDAGYWAGEHLRWLAPRQASKTLVVAPVRAMLRPVWAAGFRTAFMSLDLNLEAELLACRFAAGSVPSFLDRGTVAATALDLLERYHTGPVICLGLDFAWRDLEPHVLPHSFDEQKWCSAGRRSGVAHQLYAERERQPSLALPSGWSQPAPLDIYQGWMDRAGYADRIDIIDYNPSAVAKGLPQSDLAGIRRRLSKEVPPGRPVPLADRPMADLADHRRSIADFLGTSAERLLADQAALGQPASFYRSLCPREWLEYRLGSLPVGELNQVAARYLSGLSAEAKKLA
jgi:hypothetical protein